MHPAVQRFRANYQGFWYTFRWFILIFVITHFFDALSTCYFMGKIGWRYEYHPMIRHAARVYGTFWGPMLGFAFKMVFGCMVAIYLRKFARLIFAGTASTAAVAALYNVVSVSTRNEFTLNDILALFGF